MACAHQEWNAKNKHVIACLCNCQLTILSCTHAHSCQQYPVKPMHLICPLQKSSRSESSSSYEGFSTFRNWVTRWEEQISRNWIRISSEKAFGPQAHFWSFWIYILGQHLAPHILPKSAWVETKCAEVRVLELDVPFARIVDSPALVEERGKNVQKKKAALLHLLWLFHLQLQMEQALHWF